MTTLLPPETPSSEPEPAGVAHSRILPLIRTRQYEPGDRLPSERELATKFKVSRTMIREELSVLESMRVIERRPQSGIFVREISRDGSLDALVLEADLGLPMTQKSVRDLNEFRSIIELQAVAIACDRRTDADISLIKTILDESARLLQANESVSDEDMKFHLAVCGATQNSILMRAAYSFWLTSKERRDKYFQNRLNGERSLAQHTQIFEAIVARDKESAVLQMQEHIGGVELYWLKTISPEEGSTEE